MTVVDEALETLSLRSTVFCRMTLLGDWGFDKGVLNGAPFHLILTGEAWLRPHGGELVRLGPGDLIILPGGDRHALLSGPDAESVPFAQVATNLGLQKWEPGERYRSVDFRFGRGVGATTLISGVFSFDDRRRNPLLASLPRMLLIGSDADRGISQKISALAALLDEELSSAIAGTENVCGRLADLMFVQVIRHHLATRKELPRGWLRGMADPQIAPALAVMQRRPEHPWSVATLAREVGMSRSRFAARFQEVVGRPPLEYLTDWRMHAAADIIVQGREGLASVAYLVGYGSEVAFSKAFKRWSGSSPAEYRRRADG